MTVWEEPLRILLKPLLRPFLQGCELAVKRKSLLLETLQFVQDGILAFGQVLGNQDFSRRA